MGFTYPLPMYLSEDSARYRRARGFSWYWTGSQAFPIFAWEEGSSPIKGDAIQRRFMHQGFLTRNSYMEASKRVIEPLKLYCRMLCCSNIITL